MSVRIVRLGSPRIRGEGLRLGTVRRPPRGVPRAEYASRNFYDVWLPELAPSEPLVKLALHSSGERQWRTFQRRYRAEMRRPEAARLLALLAALSRQTDFSVGCYCAQEARCHRSVLRELLAEAGASLAAGSPASQVEPPLPVQHPNVGPRRNHPRKGVSGGENDEALP